MGFKLNETMRGFFSLKHENNRRTFHFDISFHAPSILNFMRDFKTIVNGTITMAGIAKDKPLWGTLELAIPTKKKLIYEINFTGNDGELYKLIGTKNIKYLKFINTMTHGSVEIFRNDKSYATGKMFFDLKDLPALLLSFRLV